MLTQREMLQLFNSILRMHGHNINGNPHIKAEAVLELLATYTEPMARITRNITKDGDSWHCTFPESKEEII